MIGPPSCCQKYEMVALSLDVNEELANCSAPAPARAVLSAGQTLKRATGDRSGVAVKPAAVIARFKPRPEQSFPLPSSSKSSRSAAHVVFPGGVPSATVA